MSGFENVSLWYARSCANGRIVTIINANKNEEYVCPVCGTKVVPKAKESKCTTMHFAHADSSKCSNEAICHFWFKNKYLQVGDKISITTGGKKDYIIKTIDIEKRHNKNGVIYQPDVTIGTENGEIIYFEFRNKNAKKYEDYLDKWQVFDNTVVEVDIKRIINDLEGENRKLSFRAKFYKGRLIKANYAKRRKDLDKYISLFIQPSVSLEDKRYFDMISRLEWFWEDSLNYIDGTICFDDLLTSMNGVNEEYLSIISMVFSRKNCLNIADKLNEDIKQYVLSCDQAKELRSNGIPVEVSTSIEYYGRKIDGIRVSFAGNWECILFEEIENISNSLEKICERMKVSHIKKYVIFDFCKNVDNKNIINNLSFNNYTFKLDYDSIIVYYYDKRIREIEIIDYMLSNDLFRINKDVVINFIHAETIKVARNDYNEFLINQLDEKNKMLSDFYFLAQNEKISRFKLKYCIEDELNLHIDLVVQTYYGERILTSCKYSNNVFDNTLYTSKNIHKLNKHISEIIRYNIDKQVMKKTYIKTKDVLCKQFRGMDNETR